jgi:hypothetical protein
MHAERGSSRRPAARAFALGALVLALAVPASPGRCHASELPPPPGDRSPTHRAWLAGGWSSTWTWGGGASFRLLRPSARTVLWLEGNFVAPLVLVPVVDALELGAAATFIGRLHGAWGVAATVRQR